MSPAPNTNGVTNGVADDSDEEMEVNKKAAFPENLEGSLDIRGFPETLDSLRVP